jgi:hypothetical protein
LFFPYEGATLTASASFTAQTGDWAIGFRFLDDTGSIVSMNTNTIAAMDIPIRGNHTATVPAGTFFVQFCVIESQVNAADATTFNTPMIALGTASTYTPN